MDRLLFPPKGLTVSVPKPGKAIGEQSELSITIGWDFHDSDLPRLASSAAFSMILRPAAHTKPNCLKLFEAVMTVRCIF
jgi:hypothetical protein